MKMCDLIKLYTCMYIYVYVSIVIYATKVSFSHAQGKYLIELCNMPMVALPFKYYT